ncbi:Immunity protein Imm2 [Trinickia caryophylli]|uniref:Immunity protein Imm2 n=2 Tax=Trinickia caryophylli TaxID=28094 RepID=A0A1X7GBV4_TRICW|nr:Immunity protein Imm2 [Trinickia caryophylli]
MRGWSHREVLGSVDYAFEGTYESKVENLMLCVVQLVLSGGWYPEAEQSMRGKISGQFLAEGLDNLLQGVPQAEAEQFKHDLKILKLI